MRFLNELENRKIYYRLNKIRDSILIEISINMLSLILFRR